MNQTSDMPATHTYPTAIVLNFDRGAAADARASDPAPAALPRRSENPKLVKTCNLLIQAIIMLPIALGVIALLRRLF